MTDDRATLEAHLRDAHPNLLGEGYGWSPLPRDDLASVPQEWLRTVHEANHAILYRNHADDDWLAPRPVRAADDD